MSVGEKGELLRSYDGVKWLQKSNHLPERDITSIAIVNDTFYIAGVYMEKD